MTSATRARPVATGGGVSSWTQTHLFSVASAAGTALGWIGLAASPLLLIPLAAALWGRFAGLPDQAASVLRGAIHVIDAISVTIGDAARWFALGLVIVTVTVVVQRYVFGIAMTGLATVVQERAPAELRGRIMALWLVGFLGSRPIAAAVLGGTADLVNVYVAFAVAATLSLMVTVLCRPSKLVGVNV